MKAHKFIFLRDVPALKSSGTFFNFYHENIAPALKTILSEESAPHTIGLFGSWGSGKSTIVEILNNDIKDKTPVFIFDAWKYQSDALRRTFLIKLKEFIDEVEPGLLEDKILDDIYSATSNAVTASRPSKKLTKRQYVMTFIRAHSIFIFTTVVITAWIIFNLLDSKAHWISVLKSTLLTLGSISFVLGFLKPLFEAVVKETASSFLRSSKVEMQQVTATVTKERLESPEEFESKFEDLISQFNRKMVIVFDNLDRVSGSVAISMLSTVKTFLDTQKGKGIVFIIPCDPEAIEAQITNYYSDGGNTDNMLAINPSDYLRKVFNLVIWVPEFVATDLEEYTKKCLQATGEISRLFDDDVAFVINAAFSKNPREIIQFVNNLVALTITAEQTKVKTIIEDNMPYLAKVLILRQVYPQAYKRLKKSWFQPENIYSEQDDAALVEFMGLTSRITVENAEPFLYLKDPEVSRGLINPNGLRNALAIPDEVKAVEIARLETSHGQLILFIVDLLQKYADQKEVLLNIFNTHFKVIQALGISISNNTYYEQIAKTLDTQLWQKYRLISTSDVFYILDNQKTPKNRVKAVIDRYLLAVGGQGEDLKFIVNTLESIKEHKSILSQDQVNNTISVIEANASHDEVFDIFDNKADQDTFISHTAFQTYARSLDYANIDHRLKTLKQYGAYMTKYNLSSEIVNNFASIFHQANNESSNTGEKKMAIINSVDALVRLLRDEIKDQESNETITGALVSAYNGDTTSASRVAVIKATWWIRYLLVTQQQATLLQPLNNFFANSPLLDIQDALSGWNDDTTSNLISNQFTQLAPRFLPEPDLRDFVYKVGNSNIKERVIDNVVTATPVGNEMDIEFIKSLDHLNDRTKTISLLLEKTDRIPPNFRAAYYNFISDHVSISDPRDIKLTILKQLQFLLTQDDQTHQDIGYQFLLKIKSSMSKNDLTLLIESIEKWLTQPGRSISWEYRSAFVAVSAGFSYMSIHNRHSYIAFLLNLLRPERNMQTLQVIIEQLTAISPRLATYEAELDLLRKAIEAQSTVETAIYIKTELLKLKPRRPSTGERSFWHTLAEQ